MRAAAHRLPLLRIGTTQLALRRVHLAVVASCSTLGIGVQRAPHISSWHAAILQDAHGALRAQRSELQPPKDGVSNLVLVESDPHACAYGIVVSAEDRSRSLDAVAEHLNGVLGQRVPDGAENQRVAAAPPQAVTAAARRVP